MQPQNQTPWPDNNPPQPAAPELKPHEWFQPSTYDMHRQTVTYGTPLAPPPKRKSKTRLIIAAVALLSLVLLAGSGVWAYQSLSRPTPGGVFEAAVNNSLSTSTVTQVISAKDFGSETVRYDISKPAEPKAYATIDADFLGSVFKLQQYGTVEDSYIKYESYGDTTATAQLGAYRDAWMQSRQNGKEVAEDATGVTFLFAEAQENLLGHWLFGNFSTADKQKLSGIIIAGQTYKYDPKAVTREQREGRDVFVYDITLDKTKLVELNKTAARMYNLPADIAGKAIENVSRDDYGTYILTIDIASKRLLEVKPQGPDSTEAKIEYKDYDTTQLPARPTVQADYAAFSRSFNQ